jgi:hypothetical protein
MQTFFAFSILRNGILFLQQRLQGYIARCAKLRCKMCEIEVQSYSRYGTTSQPLQYSFAAVVIQSYSSNRRYSDSKASLPMTCAHNS